MAIRKLSGKAQKVRTENTSKDKVQASDKAPPKRPVKGMGMDEATATKLAYILAKAAGFEGDDGKSVVEEPLSLYGRDGEVKEQTSLAHIIVAFVGAETREPRELEEVLCWAESPKTAHGTAMKRGKSRWTEYLRKNPLEGVAVDQDGNPTGKKVHDVPAPTKRNERGTTPTCPHSPIPFDVKSKQRTLKRNGGFEAFETAKDRIDEDGARMATKKETKGRNGLTIPQAQAALKAAKGTPARGYAAAVTKLCKEKFDGRTVSTLKSAEINQLVVLCREQNIIG